MVNKPVKTYATKQLDSNTYAIVHSGRESYIPVFESEDGERKLRASHPALDKSINEGLEFIVLDVSHLVLARLLDEEKLYNFH